MFRAKKLLDQFLGSQIPGMSVSMKDRAGQVADYARSNPMKTSALAAAILGTKTGRKLAGNVATLGGIAAIAGLGFCLSKLSVRSGTTRCAAGCVVPETRGDSPSIPECRA